MKSLASMKRKWGLVYLISFLMTLNFTACQQSDEPDNTKTSPEGWVQARLWFKGFDRLNPDSIVSADAHEMTFYSLDNWPFNWEKAEWGILYWDYDYKTEDFFGGPYVQFGTGKWVKDDYTKEDKLVYNNWISFEIIPEDELKYRVNVTVQPNETGAERRAMLFISEEREYENREVSLIVTQKPIIDPTPFEIKARYKNKTYTTQAHLDNVENLIFENAEFTELINMLGERDDIECVLLEDDVLDYFDQEDVKVNPILNALTTRATGMATHKSTRTICPNHSESLHNGYDFMTSDAIGYFGIFDDVNFKDTHFTKNFTSKYSVFDLQYTATAGLDNKISSIALAYEATDNDVCAVLTLWDQGSYNYGYTHNEAHRMSMIATPSHPHVWHSNLKKVPCLNSSKSWNDRISSCSFHFGILGTSLKDY